MRHIEFLPVEMRERPQWAIAGRDKRPLRATPDGQLHNAKVDEPSTWHHFHDAVAIARQHGLNVGYILTEDDPFTCIDLDVKPNTTDEDKARFRSIIETMNSFTEVSVSGNGIHIWVRGKIGRGARRDGVEIYSQGRFIICTGNAINSFPIVDRQPLLDAMVSQMHRRRELEPVLVEVPEAEDDWMIRKRAYEAANGDKFQALWDGQWADLGYPSQSEADMALINILGFYTDSNAQVRRMFRTSNLGKREKAQRDDYINRGLAQFRQEQQLEREQRALINLDQYKKTLEWQAYRAQIHANHVADEGTPQYTLRYTPPPPNAPAPAPKPVVTDEPPVDWPPGFVGHLARYIYNTAPRPVREVAIVGALGLMAGICGKAWNVGEKLDGLNLYLIVIAPSGTGKNHMYRGIGMIKQQCMTTFRDFNQFIGEQEPASAEALIKLLHKMPSAVHLYREIGKKLQRIGNLRDTHMNAMSGKILEAFDASAKGASMSGIAYSDSDKNIGVLGSVNHSIIGETTPGVFEQAVSSGMKEDGMLSRFLVIRYGGQRPQANRTETEPLDPDSVAWLAGLGARANEMLNNDYVHEIKFTPEVSAALREFDAEADSRINDTENEAFRSLWTRALVYVQKIAALLAIGDNYIEPKITLEHVNYAMALVRKSASTSLQVLSEGGGEDAGDPERMAVIRNLITRYIIEDLPKSQQRFEPLRMLNIIPQSLLLQKIQHKSVFKKHPLGSTRALELTCKAMVDIGELLPASKTDLAGRGFHGNAWMINIAPPAPGEGQQPQ